MIPWRLLDTASIPGGEGELRLMQRGSEFSIMVGANELMNSRVSGSEKALATLACERIRDRSSPSVLIGGLGMGFTLRAALAMLPPQAEIVVAELVPAVVMWAQGPLAELFQDCLADPRVTVRQTDVGCAIRQATSGYDAILLDVDNGPDGLSREENQALYGVPGLQASRAALRPDGVLAVWSSAPNARFKARLRDVGFAVDQIRVRANDGGRGRLNFIWMAARP